jgi:hypothetical protein
MSAAQQNPVALVPLKPRLIEQWRTSGPIDGEELDRLAYVARGCSDAERPFALADLAAAYIAQQLQGGRTDKATIWTEARQLVALGGGRLGGVA